MSSTWTIRSATTDRPGCRATAVSRGARAIRSLRRPFLTRRITKEVWICQSKRRRVPPYPSLPNHASHAVARDCHARLTHPTSIQLAPISISSTICLPWTTTPRGCCDWGASGRPSAVIFPPNPNKNPLPALLIGSAPPICFPIPPGTALRIATPVPRSHPAWNMAPSSATERHTLGSDDETDGEIARTVPVHAFKYPPWPRPSVSPVLVKPLFFPFRPLEVATEHPLARRRAPSSLPAA